MSFNFKEVCERFNLNPKRTSLHRAKCLLYGLDPASATRFEVSCAELGLDPQTTLVGVVKILKKYGVDPRTEDPELQEYLRKRIEIDRSVRGVARARAIRKKNGQRK